MEKDARLEICLFCVLRSFSNSEARTHHFPQCRCCQRDRLKITRRLRCEWVPGHNYTPLKMEFLKITGKNCTVHLFFEGQYEWFHHPVISGLQVSCLDHPLQSEHSSVKQLNQQGRFEPNFTPLIHPLIHFMNNIQTESNPKTRRAPPHCRHWQTWWCSSFQPDRDAKDWTHTLSETNREPQFSDVNFTNGNHLRGNYKQSISDLYFATLTRFATQHP